MAKAYEVGCPVAGWDREHWEKTADVAIRRWDGIERRRKRFSHADRVEDLAKGLVARFERDPKVVGPLVEDYRYLAFRIADALGAARTAPSGTEAGAIGVIASRIYERAASALGSLPVDERADTYVVSFLVYGYEDDPRRPELTIGTNTERQVASAAQRASDEAEARWNYAFWLQNELATVGGPLDSDGETLIRASFDASGLGFAADDDSDTAIEIGNEMTRRFVNDCVQAAQRLHETGGVVATFGRSIPVLVHELEYCDEIVEQNRRANPLGLTNEFAAWVDSAAS